MLARLVLALGVFLAISAHDFLTDFLTVLGVFPTAFLGVSSLLCMVLPTAKMEGSNKYGLKRNENCSCLRVLEVSTFIFLAAAPEVPPNELALLFVPLDTFREAEGLVEADFLRFLVALLVAFVSLGVLSLGVLAFGVATSRVSFLDRIDDGVFALGEAIRGVLVLGDATGSGVIAFLGLGVLVVFRVAFFGVALLGEATLIFCLLTGDLTVACRSDFSGETCVALGDAR